MGKPSAPTPPNPVTVDQAQTASNLQTAQTQSALNNLNQVSPYGTVSYTQPGGPDTQWTQTTQLSPSQQAIYNQQVQAEQGALGTANTQMGRIQGALGQSVTPGQLQGVPQGTGPYSYGQNLGYFNPGQAVQGQIGPQNYNQSINQAIQAQFGSGYSLLAPQLAQQTEQTQAQLAAQGLNPNDAAYQNAWQLMGNQQGQELAQLAGGAVQAGAGLQSQLFGEQLGQGQFANQAAAQMYGQNQGLAGFYNQAQNQNLQNLLGAQGQTFNQQLASTQLQNQQQQQAFQQAAYGQELPINEFSALMGLGQVQAPQAANYTPSQVATTDVLGAYGLQSQVQQANYAQQMQNYGSALGGLFNLGGAGITKFSDRRLKRDIHAVGRRGPFKLYVYRLEGESGWREGVMADEVRPIRPDCVLEGPDGYLRVDYWRLAA